MDYGFSNPDYGYAPHERPEGRLRGNTAAASRNGRRQGNSPYHETDGHAGPRRTEIVPAAAAQKPPAALPDIAVVFRPDVSHAQHRLDVPSPADNPLVSVGKPRAVEEALVTAVAHAEEFHTPGVVVGIENVKPEKCPAKRLRSQ